MSSRISRTMRMSLIAGGLALVAGATLWTHFEAEASPRRIQTAFTDARSSTSAVVANRSIPVAIEKELMITDLSVVEDPVRTTWPIQPTPRPTATVSHRSSTTTTTTTTRRFNTNLASATLTANTSFTSTTAQAQSAWTFGKLMTDMSGNHDPSDFVLDWLELWEQDQMVNGNVVPARPSIRQVVIDPWLQASGGSRLDMSKAPFRLLAIVNRIDLRHSNAYSGGGINAGEARFVFGVTTQSGTPLSFTVILEFGVVASTTSEVKQWAEDWHALGSMSFGSSFNQALQNLTDRFAGANAAPNKPNGSGINQIRTNEIALAGPWELREFVIDSRSGKLVQTTTKQTPDASMSGGRELSDWLNANAGAVLAGRHTVPAQWLAGGNPESFTWNANVQDPEVRHAFAVNTCNGCHTTETGTGFTHVNVRAAGNEANLSAFLTGTTVSDPINPSLSHSFNDLDRRADDLRRVLQSTVTQLAAEEPARIVH